MISPNNPNIGGPARKAEYPIIETILTLVTAPSDSSPAAEMPTGKPSDVPSPHKKTPTDATGRYPENITRASPENANPEAVRRTGTRPNRLRKNLPAVRPRNMAVKNRVNMALPVIGCTLKPSTMARGSQSLADPSAKAMPKTTRPINSVLGITLLLF